MNIRQDAAARSIPSSRSHHSAFSPQTKAPIKVALVHDWLTGLRGGEKCLERLCRMFPDATIHTLIHDPGKTGPIIEAMRIRTSPLQRIPGIARHYRKLLPLMPAAVSRLDVGEVDLVISLSHCVAKAVRVPAGLPHICYCFTPMRYAWDGRSAYLDKWREGSLKRRLAESALDRLAAWDARTAAKVTRFVAISKTIQDRITRNYGRDSVVVAPPVDTDFYLPSEESQREDFYLVASALVPYKRIDQAVAACERLGRKLVVIGTGPEADRLRNMAGPNATFLGYQPDDVLRDHFRRCRALLFPGEEDFGIVPIEALACGASVIALNAGGVAETVDAAVGTLYDEPTAEGLREAIGRFETTTLKSNSQNARRAKAERFSAVRFDEGMAEVIADVLGHTDSHGQAKIVEPITSVSR